MEVKMDDYLCELCGVSMPRNSLEVHEQGRKHKLKLHEQHIVDTKVKRGIFVGNITPNINPLEVECMFAQFGHITDFFVGNGFALVQFDKEEVAQRLIACGSISFNNRFLVIKPRQVKPSKSPDTQELEAKESEILDVIKGLKDLSTFDKELPKFLSIVEQDPAVINKYKLLCADLERILQLPYANCHVHAFGSTITGLMSRTSDVDVFVQLPEHFKTDTSYAQKAVKHAKKHLSKPPKLFTNCIAIPKAKTPIIKCVHIPTKIRCDVNFKNMLGVCNSHLIRYYIELDPKIKPLMILTKYWAKAHELTSHQNKFTNYALVMIIIFFLQQKPFCLPSVHSLQANPEVQRMCSGWNGGFERKPCDLSYLREITFLQLLQKFFEFYANFDYQMHVICPYLGEPIEKTMFIKPESILPVYVHYLAQNNNLELETPLCVQDPFEHVHNLTKTVTSKFLSEFTAYCKLNSSHLSSNQPSLYTIFTERPTTITNTRALDNLCEFTVYMGSYLTYLEEKITDMFEGEREVERIRKVWFDYFGDHTKKFLTEVMKFEISNVSTSVMSSKAPKLDGQLNINDDIFDKVVYHCKGYVNVWESRKSISKDIRIPDFNTCLEQEIFISDYIQNVLYKGARTEEPLIDITLTLSGIKSPISSLVRLDKNQAKKGCFLSFALYFSGKFPSLFGSYEKELNDCAKKRNLIDTNESCEKAASEDESIENSENIHSDNVNSDGVISNDINTKKDVSESRALDVIEQQVDNLNNSVAENFAGKS